MDYLFSESTINSSYTSLPETAPKSTTIKDYHSLPNKQAEVKLNEQFLLDKPKNSYESTSSTKKPLRPENDILYQWRLTRKMDLASSAVETKIDPFLNPFKELKINVGRSYSHDKTSCKQRCVIDKENILPKNAYHSKDAHNSEGVYTTIKNNNQCKTYKHRIGEEGKDGNNLNVDKNNTCKHKNISKEYVSQRDVRQDVYPNKHCGHNDNIDTPNHINCEDEDEGSSEIDNEQCAENCAGTDIIQAGDNSPRCQCGLKLYKESLRFKKTDCVPPHVHQICDILPCCHHNKTQHRRNELCRPIIKSCNKRTGCHCKRVSTRTSSSSELNKKLSCTDINSSEVNNKPTAVRKPISELRTTCEEDISVKVKTIKENEANGCRKDANTRIMKQDKEKSLLPIINQVKFLNKQILESGKIGNVLYGLFIYFPESIYS